MVNRNNNVNALRKITFLENEILIVCIFFFEK